MSTQTNTMRTRAVIFLAASVLSLGARAEALGNALELSPSSTLSLDGDSTLHRYSAKAEEFHASFALTPAGQAAASKSVAELFADKEIAGAELVIPVAKLSSGENGLDDNMRKALHGDKVKYITLSIKSYEVQPASEKGKAFKVSLHGRLSVAGVGKDIDVLATALPQSNALQISGSKDVLMSDYKVEAPSFMFGVMKTKDLVTIKFELSIRRKAADPLTAR
jgi:polyisoprenoid-binding protein YceI